MTPTTLPANASDQTLLDHDTRTELLVRIAMKERLLVLLRDPAAPLNAILKITRALEKMQDRPLKQQKAELAAKRQEQRDRQLAINEARLELRIRALDLREAEYVRKKEASAAREVAREEKAARLAERQARAASKISTAPSNGAPVKIIPPSPLEEESGTIVAERRAA